ncbi:MAG: hypothetical protein WAU53_06570 [Rhodoplanes sp.]
MIALLKPSEVFQVEVEPAFTEYLADLLNERRAKYVARAIDHHLDWTYEYYERVDKSRLLNTGSLRTFRFELFSRCPELQIMWDISDAAHHRFLTRPGIARVVTTASDAFAVQTDELWINGYDRPFLPAATLAVRFWRSWPD